MPKMTYVKGAYVRVGSWGTKRVDEQWRVVLNQLENHSLVTILRLSHLLFEDGSAYSQSARESYERMVIWRLEELRDAINVLLARFPKQRRILALENVTGRTPEEAAVFRAKAAALRQSIGEDAGGDS